jgi:hypothetical protein
MMKSLLLSSRNWDGAHHVQMQQVLLMLHLDVTWYWHWQVLFTSAAADVEVELCCCCFELKAAQQAFVGPSSLPGRGASVAKARPQRAPHWHLCNPDHPA